MKTKFAIAAIALALSSSAAFATETQNPGGTVTFLGNVKAMSCDITVDGNDYNNAEVKLDDVFKTDLVANSAVKTKDFTIGFKGCKVLNSSTMEVDNSVTVAWDASTPLATGFESQGWLKNESNAGGASDVYLALFNKGGTTPIVPGSDNAATKAELNNGNAEFVYTVGYVTNNPTAVTPGKVESHAVYTVTYE